LNDSRSRDGGQTHAHGAPAVRDSALHRNTTAMLGRLPPGARLDLLSARYPRIANRIAFDWAHPEALKPYLRELLMPDRPGRQGFPPDVLLELWGFESYYSNEAFPARRSVWDMPF